MSLSTIPLNAERIVYLAAHLLDLMCGRSVKSVHLLMPPLEVFRRRPTHTFAVSDDEVARAVHFLRALAINGIGVEDVLREENLFQRNLEYRFRHALGWTPYKEIRSCSYQLCSTDATQTTLPIEEIAINSGFSSRTNFDTAFRRMTGKTPTDYRRYYGLMIHGRPLPKILQVRATIGNRNDLEKIFRVLARVSESQLLFSSPSTALNDTVHELQANILRGAQ